MVEDCLCPMELSRGLELVKVELKYLLKDSGLFLRVKYYIPVLCNVVWFYFALIELLEVTIELFGIVLEG